MTFYIGQKVVCVAPFDGDWSMNPTGYFFIEVPGPKDKDILTISGITPDGEGLRFVEFPLSEYPSPEYGYGRQYFRPLVERKTDITIFTKILNTDKAHA